MTLRSRIDHLEATLVSHLQPEHADIPEQNVDALMERYIRERNQPGVERIKWAEWVWKSNGWETLEDFEHDQEWTANMEAGFPRKWRHVQKPDGLWSWAWADESPCWKSWGEGRGQFAHIETVGKRSFMRYCPHPAHGWCLCRTQRDRGKPARNASRSVPPSP